MLIIAIIALLGAIGIIAFMLKRGSSEVVPVEDISTLPEGTWPSDEIKQETIDHTIGHHYSWVFCDVRILARVKL